MYLPKPPLAVVPPHASRAGEQRKRPGRRGRVRERDNIKRNKDGANGRQQPQELMNSEVAGWYLAREGR